MTGLAIGGLPASDLERPRAIALDFHKSNLRSHPIAAESRRSQPGRRFTLSAWFRFETVESGADQVFRGQIITQRGPEFAVEQVQCVPSARPNPEEPDSVRKCDVSGWYELLISA